jgi:hypothetical protein
MLTTVGTEPVSAADVVSAAGDEGTRKIQPGIAHLEAALSAIWVAENSSAEGAPATYERAARRTVTALDALLADSDFWNALAGDEGSLFGSASPQPDVDLEAVKRLLGDELARTMLRVGYQPPPPPDVPVGVALRAVDSLGRSPQPSRKALLVAAHVAVHDLRDDIARLLPGTTAVQGVPNDDQPLERDAGAGTAGQRAGKLRRLFRRAKMSLVCLLAAAGLVAPAAQLDAEGAAVNILTSCGVAAAASAAQRWRDDDGDTEGPTQPTPEPRPYAAEPRDAALAALERRRLEAEAAAAEHDRDAALARKLLANKQLERFER